MAHPDDRLLDEPEDFEPVFDENEDGLTVTLDQDGNPIEDGDEDEEL